MLVYQRVTWRQHSAAEAPVLTWPPSGSPAVASALVRRPVSERRGEFLKWDLFEHHQWVCLKMGNTPWENYENPLGNGVGVLYFQTNSPNLIWNITKSTKWRSVNLEKTWKNISSHVHSFFFKSSLYLAEWCEYITSLKSVLRCFGMIPCSHDQKCDGQ